MPRISAKNQITIPVSALEEAGLHAGDDVAIDPPSRESRADRDPSLTSVGASRARAPNPSERSLSSIDRRG